MKKFLPVILAVAFLASEVLAANRSFRPSSLRRLGKEAHKYLLYVQEEDYTNASQWIQPERRRDFLLKADQDKIKVRMMEFEVVSLEKVDLRATPVSTDDPMALPQDRASVLVWITFYELPSYYMQKRLYEQHWVKVHGQWFLDGSDEVEERGVSGTLTDYGPDQVDPRFRRRRFPDLK